MADVLVGVVAVLAGLGLAFRGWLYLRILIPIWGAFAGFFVGAGLVDSFTGDGFLATALGWVVGVAVALVFGLLAYLYFEVSVILGMGAIGFSIAAAVMVAMGVTWSWLIVLVGLALGLLFAFIAIAGNLPKVLLVVFSATAGATIAVAGMMLILGVIDIADLGEGATTQRVDEDWWWWLVYAFIVVAGIVGQFRLLDAVTASLREQWREAGGRELGGASPAETAAP